MIMNTYFNTQQRIELLKATAKLWVGTPFASSQSDRGIGADCIGLVTGVIRDCGYPMEGVYIPNVRGLSAPEQGKPNVLVDMLVDLCRKGNLVRKEVEEPDEPGDIMTIKHKNVEYHLCLRIDSEKILFTCKHGTAMMVKLDRFKGIKTVNRYRLCLI